MPTPRAGRPRDDTIDRAVLGATHQLLAEQGYDAMSLTGIADLAGTTRQAIYRRWRTKADLVVAAIESLPEAAAIEPTGNHRVDLVNELQAFRQGVLRAGGLSMVGTMLRDSTDAELRRAYQARVVAPRRTRIRHIVQRAIEDGDVDPDADVEFIVAGCTGVLYALALAGEPVPVDYATRVAEGWLGRRGARATT